MSARRIGSSFSVTTLDEGRSPNYIQTQEAWSNDATTASATTPPTISGSWSDSTPPKSATYLWRRSRPMTYNEATRTYTEGIWTYQRLSGENGTSISVKGHVANVSSLPSTHTDGDAYVVDANGHLYMWSDEADDWVDIGLFQGESGKTYFTHIAWAKTVTFKTPSTPPTGQLTKPNASSVTGFSTSPASDKPYMGYLVNEDVDDSTRGTDYTWQYNRGAKGDTGDGAIIADVTNEMGSVLCDTSGYTIGGEQSVATSISMYNGHTQVPSFSSIKCYIDGTQLSSSYVDELSPKKWWRAVVSGTNVTIYVKEGVLLSSPEKVDINVTASVGGTSYIRDLWVTVNGVKMGKDGVIQELLPSINALSFAYSSSNTLTPASYDLTMSIKKIVGEITTTQTITQSGLNVRYSTSSMPSSKTDGTAWGSSDGTSGITWNGTTATITNAVNAQRIYVAAYTSGNVLVDRETIPIVKGGTNGTTYEIRSTVDSITIPSGQSSAQLSCSFSFFVKRGDAAPVAYTAYYAMYRRTGATYTMIGNAARGTSVNLSRMVYSAYDAIVIYIFDSEYSGNSPESQSYLAKCEIIVMRDGAQGARGKTGRFFYYGGEFNTGDTTEFGITDSEAPFFLYQNKYYVWIGENGTYTMAQMGVPVSNSNFELMWTDFKYLISEAIFSQFANLGSSIINGDWMLSQYGTLYDASNNATSINADDASVIIDNVVYNYRNAYRMFDPTSPNEPVRGSVNFVPNYSLDMKRGWSYQNISEVRGTFKAYGSNGRSTQLSSAFLGFGFRDADIFSISCEGSGTSRNVKLNIGAGETGMTYMTIESRGTFNNQVTTLLKITNQEGGSEPSIVIHKGGIAMTSVLGTIIKQKTWDELLS